MKKSIKKAACLIILMMAVVLGGSAQEYIKLERSKRLQLEGESKNKDVLIKVDEGFNYLNIKVKGQVEVGNIHIELIDPEGKVRRDFNLEAGKTTDPSNTLSREGSVYGKTEKSFRNPLSGEWFVRVQADNAKGHVKVYSLLIYNPRTDLIELEQVEEDTDEHIR